MGVLRRVPWWTVPLGIFVLTRVVDAVLIVLLARHQVPSTALAPDLPMPTLVDPPTYLHVIANWDGQWYRHIVDHGYPSQLPTKGGQVQQNAWAFYPGYPAVVWLLTRVGASFGVAASVVSLTAGATAMCLLYGLLRERASDYLAALSVLALCCAPAAPVFQAAYSDSLGLLLLVLGLICLERGRHTSLLLVGLLLALTRPITPPLALAAGAQLLRRWRRRDVEPFPRAERWKLGIVTIALAGFAAVWPLVAGLASGDMSAYSETQVAWRSAVGARPDTWLSSLFDGADSARWFFVAAVVAGAVAIAWRNRQWTFGTRIWTVTYPAFILAATPATMSIFRYSLLVGPAWWPLRSFDGRGVSRRWRFALMAVVAVGGITTQVLWLDWYFLLTPDSRGVP